MNKQSKRRERRKELKTKLFINTFIKMIVISMVYIIVYDIKMLTSSTTVSAEVSVQETATIDVNITFPHNSSLSLVEAYDNTFREVNSENIDRCLVSSVNYDMLEMKIKSLEEDIASIKEVKRLAEEEQKEAERKAEEEKQLAYEEDLKLLSSIIYYESRGETDTMQLYVGSVVLNRVNSPNYPNTIKEVIFQAGQYAPAISGAIYGYESSDSTREKAAYLLENGSILPSNVVYQAEFKQGSGTYEKIPLSWKNGMMYFCYE